MAANVGVGREGEVTPRNRAKALKKKKDHSEEAEERLGESEPIFPQVTTRGTGG